MKASVFSQSNIGVDTPELQSSSDGRAPQNQSQTGCADCREEFDYSRLLRSHWPGIDTEETVSFSGERQGLLVAFATKSMIF